MSENSGARTSRTPPGLFGEQYENALEARYTILYRAYESMDESEDPVGAHSIRSEMEDIAEAFYRSRQARAAEAVRVFKETGRARAGYWHLRVGGSLSSTTLYLQTLARTYELRHFYRPEDHALSVSLENHLQKDMQLTERSSDLVYLHITFISIPPLSGLPFPHYPHPRSTPVIHQASQQQAAAAVQPAGPRPSQQRLYWQRRRAVLGLDNTETEGRLQDRLQLRNRAQPAPSSGGERHMTPADALDPVVPIYEEYSEPIPISPSHNRQAGHFTPPSSPGDPPRVFTVQQAMAEWYASHLIRVMVHPGSYRPGSGGSDRKLWGDKSSYQRKWEGTGRTCDEFADVDPEVRPILNELVRIHSRPKPRHPASEPHDPYHLMWKNRNGTSPSLVAYFADVILRMDLDPSTVIAAVWYLQGMALHEGDVDEGDKMREKGYALRLALRRTAGEHDEAQERRVGLLGLTLAARWLDDNKYHLSGWTSTAYIPSVKDDGSTMTQEEKEHRFSRELGELQFCALSDLHWSLYISPSSFADFILACKQELTLAPRSNDNRYSIVRDQLDFIDNFELGFEKAYRAPREPLSPASPLPRAMSDPESEEEQVAILGSPSRLVPSKLLEDGASVFGPESTVMDVEADESQVEQAVDAEDEGADQKEMEGVDLIMEDQASEYGSVLGSEYSDYFSEYDGAPRFIPSSRRCSSPMEMDEEQLVEVDNWRMGVVNQTAQPRGPGFIVPTIIVPQPAGFAAAPRLAPVRPPRPALAVNTAFDPRRELLARVATAEYSPLSPYETRRVAVQPNRLYLPLPTARVRDPHRISSAILRREPNVPDHFARPAQSPTVLAPLMTALEAELKPTAARPRMVPAVNVAQLRFGGPNAEAGPSRPRVPLAPISANIMDYESPLQRAMNRVLKPMNRTPLQYVHCA